MRFSVYCLAFSFEFEYSHNTQNKNFIEEKFIFQFIFNLGLALTHLTTTRPGLQQVNLTWAHDLIESCSRSAVNLENYVTPISSKIEPAIWSPDTGQQILCFDRCQMTISWMSNIKEGCQKPRLHVSVNPLAGVYMSAILRDSVVIVVEHTCPWAIPLAVITMRKSIHGFLWFPYGY